MFLKKHELSEAVGELVRLKEEMQELRLRDKLCKPVYHHDRKIFMNQFQKKLQIQLKNYLRRVNRLRKQSRN